MQQPAWRAEFRSLNRAPKAHFARRAEVCSAGEGGGGGGGGPGAAALDLDSEKEPLGPWDSDVRVGFFFVFSPQGRQVWAPSFFFSRPISGREFPCRTGEGKVVTWPEVPTSGGLLLGPPPVGTTQSTGSVFAEKPFSGE